MRYAVILLVILAVPVVAYAATLKVPSQYSTIQDAIDAASGGDMVLVASGSYVENIDFKGKAITVRSEHGAAVTTIDGNLTGSVVKFQSGEGSASVLDGFTLTNGSGTSGGSYTHGGGIYCNDSSPTIMNNIIMGNLAESIGGGICCRSLSSFPVILNNAITENTAKYCGGGIYCEFSSPTIMNNTIMGNKAITGGGIHSTDSSLTITNTILWGNSATYAKEIYFDYWWYVPTLTISYSDVEGRQSSCYVMPGSTLNWGPGMIDADPLFVDTANGDFHINFPSPCKDTGDNSVVQPELETDFEGDGRCCYGTVDMGADEFFTHLYWTGDATPGGNVEIKFVGLPGTAPVGLCIGTGVLDPPIKSMWGDWYLQFPILGPMDLGPITSPEGVLIIPATIPGSPPAPYSLPLQALIGAELTNLSVLEVK